MKFKEFKSKVIVSMEEMCRAYYREYRDSMKIKKEEVAVKNFENIFYATLKLSYKKGFQAMSLRDLCAETGLSMGALYSYFSSKEELLQILHAQGAKSVMDVLIKYTKDIAVPVEKLRMAIRVHVYLSELMGYWFYFFFMETKNLSKEERKVPVESELWTEKLYNDILKQGIKEGVFAVKNTELTGSAIKALLQDWYLKRWKYQSRNTDIDDYADFVIEMIESFVLKKE